MTGLALHEAGGFQPSVVPRVIAFAIAIAGFIDPAISVSGASRARVAVVVQHPASATGDGVRDRLTRDLAPSFDVVAHLTSDAAAAVVIGERYPDEPLPDALLIATVTTPDADTPGVRIVSVGAPREVPPATVMHLDVELEGTGVAGRTTDVTAAIAGLEVGRASHRWTADEKRWRAPIDAVPVGEPPFVLRVVAASSASSGLVGSGAALPPRPPSTEPRRGLAEAQSAQVGSRTVADTVVDVRRSPFRVEFYDPRPSWASTFVRRALEADARFQVAALSFTSRGISARTGGAVAPGDLRIDAFDVVVVGGLDRLSAADAGSLDRYVRERGGALVLVPDERVVAGPARDLVYGLSGGARREPDPVERLLEQPATLAVMPPAASLQASELLVLRELTPGSDVIARVPGSDGAAVIASMPRGEGRLLMSGAMDAWRFRAADTGAFDRFWQSTIAGLALAAPPPISISVMPPLLRPGEQGDVIVRVRSRDVASVSASIDGDQPIRLRPEPEIGAYRGRFTAKGAPGRSTIVVRAAAAQPSASRTLLVRADVQRVRSTAAPSLSMLAASHRGIDVTPDHVAELARFVRNTVARPRATLVRHPMRSGWWLVPFAACLCIEWWLRRRRGLR